jgi:hypothetical protein
MVAEEHHRDWNLSLGWASAISHCRAWTASQVGRGFRAGAPPDETALRTWPSRPSGSICCKRRALLILSPCSSRVNLSASTAGVSGEIGSRAPSRTPARQNGRAVTRPSPLMEAERRVRPLSAVLAPLECPYKHREETLLRWLVGELHLAMATPLTLWRMTSMTLSGRWRSIPHMRRRRLGWAGTRSWTQCRWWETSSTRTAHGGGRRSTACLVERAQRYALDAYRQCHSSRRARVHDSVALGADTAKRGPSPACPACGARRSSTRLSGLPRHAPFKSPQDQAELDPCGNAANHMKGRE